MRTITQEELTKVLEEHKLWLTTNGEEGTRADLSDTDLSGKDLSQANLSGAYLSKANLSKADLSHIKGKFIFAFQLGKDFGYYCDNYVRVGCEYHTLDYWLENGTDIGKANNYTEVDIARYMDMLHYINEKYNI